MTYKTNHTPPRIVFEKEAYSDLESKIEELDAEFKVREIELTFTGERYFFGNVTASFDAFQFIRDIILKGIEVQEHFIALYLNQANKIIGYYHHSTGTINSTPVDIEIVAAVALKTLAKAVIISHNHPSGNLTPSEADKAITKRMKEALKLFDVALLDHIIVTDKGHFSFADTGDRSLQGTDLVNSRSINQLREEILKQLKKVTQANAPNLFALVNSVYGYSKVEEMVIRKVIHDQMVPAAVIPLLEQELEMV
ncbi:MAG: JAB domain-containing protein [Flavobacteriales bacterium]|jgi:DNA repair protein RadC